MTMSVIPVAFMTAVTWIRYGINVKQDYVASLKMIVDSGISQNLAEILIVTGPVLGFLYKKYLHFIRFFGKIKYWI